MPGFLEIDIREKQKHEKRIQTSVDNTISIPHQSKTSFFSVLNKNLFLFLEKNVFKNPKNSVVFALFFVEVDTKKDRQAYWQKA